LAGLCADQVGSDICTAAGIIARSYAPVLALCRRLIRQAGYDPATPLQVYRGATLALTMRGLAEAAKLIHSTVDALKMDGSSSTIAETTKLVAAAVTSNGGTHEHRGCRGRLC
jgi:hypothetical protein